MNTPGAQLEAIFLELGDLWSSCGRTKITVAEVPGAHGLKTIHRGMTREWAQANRAHYEMTLVHIEDLEAAGLIEVAYKRKTWVFYRLVPEAVEALAFALGGAPQPEFVLATAEGTVAR